MIVTASSFELHPTGSFYGKIVRIEEDISKFDAKPQLVLTVETEPIYGEKKNAHCCTGRLPAYLHSPSWAAFIWPSAVKKLVPVWRSIPMTC